MLASHGFQNISATSGHAPHRPAATKVALEWSGRHWNRRTMKRRAWGLTTVSGLVLLFCAAWAYFAFWKPDQEALGILAKMNTVYADCKSFRDSIDVTTIEESSTGSKETKTFIASMVFARPASLRYEFDSVENGVRKQVSLLCANSAKLIHSFGGLDTPVEKRMTWSADFSCKLNGKPYLVRGDDLAGSVYYLLSPTAFTISEFAGLLLPDDIGGLQFREMADSRVVGSEKVEGFDCFVLESRQWKSRLWIDKNSYALRKTFEWDPIWTVCILHPVFDGPVRDGEFKLDLQ